MVLTAQGMLVFLLCASEMHRQTYQFKKVRRQAPVWEDNPILDPLPVHTHVY